MAFADETILPNDTKAPVADAPTTEPRLRLWPAAMLFVVLATTRLAVYALDQLPASLFPVVFLGPLATEVLIALWWLFASRARIRDRWIGFLLLVAAGFAASWYAHASMQGMVFMFYTLPIAVAGFLVTLFLLTGFGRGAATWAAVTVGVACFGGSVLARNNGFSGDFRASFDWRWQPNAEEEYLASRKSDQQAAATGPSQGASVLGAVTWSEFRGPKRDGVVPGVRLGEDWVSRPPKELWRHRVGPGWSSFAATSELIYTQEQRGDAEAVVCYKAATGAEVWCHTYPSRFSEPIGGPGPRATPTLRDGALYALGAAGVLRRLNALTGELAWTRDLRTDADRKPPIWGFSSSPLVVHGLVIVHAGGAGDKGMLAYDAQTGALRWGAAAGDHSYSSPHLATVADQPCVLMLTNAGMSAYEPLTGKLTWVHGWKFDGYRAIQPLVVGDGVLLGTGMGAGTRRIDVKRTGEDIDIAERWTALGMKPGFNDYVAHRGHAFGFDNNIFACLDLETGQRKWKEGRYGTGQVLLLPDGDQLLVTSEKGELILLRANPERHEELARFPALTGKTWNHPILVGNRVYVRNGEEAACFELTLVASP